MNSLGRRSPTMQGPVSSGRSYLSRLLLRPAWLLALTLGIVSPASAQAPGTWASIADLNQPRAEHTATLLANGTVLISGGRDAADQPLASAEIYDPATGGFPLLASPLPAPVWGHAATRLDDGTVLIAGGQRGARYRRAAQVFDPASDTFAALTPMSTPRGRHTATLLRDGRVVVIGGTDGVGPLASLEIYDPTTRTFSLAPSALAVARQDHTATLLPDGRVLVAGGSNASGALESAELYDPTAGTVSPAGPLNVPRTLASAALLLDGTVLVAGGQTTTSEDLDSAEVYDAATNTFVWLAAPMGTKRSGHLGVQLLHNGKVLISGGTSGGQLVASAEVYDPVTGAFQPGDSPGTARRLFGANFFELPYTGILLATGGLDGGDQPLASSEVFFYPTLRSDKPDYAPGETVTLMGEGGRPNEQVAINIRESSGDPDTNLTATADASGAFTNSEFRSNPDSSDVGVRFLATPTGQASGWTAQTTFTDSPTILSVSLNGGTPWTPPSPSTNGAPVTVLPGATISTTITVQTTSAMANRWRSTSWQIGSGAVNCVNTPDHNNAANSTETFNITAPSLTGTYSVSFIAYSDDICIANPSSPLTLSNAIIVKDNTTTTITSDSPDPSVVGQPYTVSWTVTVAHLGSGTPTGTVSVNDGTGASCSAAVATGGCSLTSTTAGAKTLTATYGGDCNFNTSTSPGAPHQVNVRPTTTTVNCTPASVPVGSPTSCTATVTDTGPGTAITPTGTVSFASSGAGTFGSSSCGLSGSGNSATCSVTYTPSAVGTHTITASYSGDTTHATSSGTFDVTVIKHGTTTDVSCTPATAPVGSATSCTATVTDPAPVSASAPTGTVRFTSCGGTLSSSRCPPRRSSDLLSGSGNTATCSVTYTPSAVATHTITASYSGDTTHAMSSGTTVVTALTHATTTGVNCMPASVPVGSATSCTETGREPTRTPATARTRTAAFASKEETFSA